jgi:hypothetical protein
MSVWGHLATRYEEERPRKLLALDGGGIRGIITLEILARMESLLAQATGRGSAFRLSDFFDYIGGTSTGAIIAAGLARGMPTQELLRFYLQAGPAMFDKAWLLTRLKNLYRSEPLADMLQKTFGAETDLRPEHLRCLLLVVTRNVTTDSAWPICSNPLARYNDLARPDCNLRIPLWKIVRASTAAPIYFPPEVVNWDPQNPEKSFVFVDGGVSPYNNPAFLLYRMATHPAYRLGWKTGERNLLLVSVGTGTAPHLDSGVPAKFHWSNLVDLPVALMYGALLDQDINCRTAGRCVHGGLLDRELDDLVPRDERGEPLPRERDLGRAFLYARYNADLSREGLDRLGLTDVDPTVVQQLDSADYVEDLSRVGRAAAREVSLDHFTPFLER